MAKPTTLDQHQTSKPVLILRFRPFKCHRIFCHGKRNSIMATSANGEQVWVDLEIEAWRANKEDKSDRGINGVRTGARRRWNTMPANTSQQLQLALQQWRTAQAEVAKLRSIYDTQPDKTDLPAVKTYYKAAEALAPAMRISNTSLTQIKNLHGALQNTRHDTTEWLDEQDIYFDSFDEIESASLKWFKFWQAADKQQQGEGQDNQVPEPPVSAAERSREHSLLPGDPSDEPSATSPPISIQDGTQDDSRSAATVAALEDLEDFVKLHHERQFDGGNTGATADRTAQEWQNKLEEYRRADALRQMQGKLDSRWVGPIWLDKGASGQCNTWVKQSSRGVIVDVG